MNTEKIKTLVREGLSAESGQFRPCAFFDERLDCIRVIARDCSVLEERINGRITVLLDNHYQGSGQRRYVGFVIKGAKHFCVSQGFDLRHSVKLTELLDAVLAKSPEIVVQWFVDIVAKPLIEQEKIERVEIPELTLQTS